MSNSKLIEWASGYPARIGVGVAHAELERIRAANAGELTTAVVVEAAREAGNILHRQVFDLSKHYAAEEYYKSRAQLMIRSVVVRFEDGTAEPTRVYRVIRADPSPVAKGRTVKVYSDIEEALADPEHRAYVLEQALAEAVAWRKRYDVLAELAEIFTAIDEAVS